MDYKDFISHADEGSLEIRFDPETGIIKIRMRVNGVPVRCQSSVRIGGGYDYGIYDDDGYVFGIYDDDLIEKTLKRLSRTEK